ncbi:MAG TPA: DegT/DnrJ/EryC1/StrS family aminotransferase [Bryobacteraceae bacterium]|nr:DegT/DnrJ/EryC1/StrS family aminotransferase [Bryobacteraceae bacterium]
MTPWLQPIGEAGEIPFLDLARESRRLKPELMAAFEEVLDSGIFLFGPRIEALEAELARQTGARHAVAVGSGTMALEILLRAFGIGPGDEVITTPASMYATAKSIADAGASAVFADIVPGEYNLDPEQAAQRITARTKAILTVHLYGRPADVKALRTLAERRGLLLLEDAAQAFGASVDGRPAGGWGHGAALSFYPSKNLGALGDAGAVVTSDGEAAERARSLRFLGFTGERDCFGPQGIAGRMDEVQAAFLLVKLRHAEEMLRRRLELAACYDRELPQALVRPPAGNRVLDVRHLYVICCGARDALREQLRGQGIATQIHYRVPLHRQALFAGQDSSLPVAEAWSREVLSLPLYPDLTDAEQGRVIEAIRAFSHAA